LLISRPAKGGEVSLTDANATCHGGAFIVVHLADTLLADELEVMVRDLKLWLGSA
jgi:hypothetical protein